MRYKAPRLRVRGPPLSCQPEVRHRAYGSQMIFWSGIIPQHQATTGRHQPGHAHPEEGGQAARPGQVSDECLDQGRLWDRGGRGRQPHCRFIRTGNRLRSARGMAIAWNVRAPGRFERAGRLKVPITSYGGQRMRAECPDALPVAGRTAWQVRGYDGLTGVRLGVVTCQNRQELRTNPGETFWPNRGVYERSRYTLAVSVTAWLGILRISLRW